MDQRQKVKVAFWTGLFGSLAVLALLFWYIVWVKP